MEPEALRGSFGQVCRALNDLAGIESASGSTEPRYDRAVLRNLSLYLDYVGPLRRTRRARQLKIDITFDERIVNAPVRHQLLREFSDEPLHDVQVRVYILEEIIEEIIAEKIRTLLQRTEPRDPYDVWRLLEEYGTEIDWQLLRQTFHVNCEHRELTIVEPASILSSDRVAKYRTAWEQRLGEQVPDLPSLDQVTRETRRRLRELLG